MALSDGVCPLKVFLDTRPLWEVGHQQEGDVARDLAKPG